jgi:hypothetical protein
MVTLNILLIAHIPLMLHIYMICLYRADEEATFIVSDISAATTPGNHSYNARHE